ncbi:hypothetical protein ACFOD9_10205 [Novosphingobium bradum]|uniref:Uncharacterized protein n=1 Tax=Novosphingobium bradum TaxID=1737444 RepID=A0ABV7IQN3_9SPHN
MDYFRQSLRCDRAKFLEVRMVRIGVNPLYCPVGIFVADGLMDLDSGIRARDEFDADYVHGSSVIMVMQEDEVRRGKWQSVICHPSGCKLAIIAHGITPRAASQAWPTSPLTRIARRSFAGTPQYPRSARSILDQLAERSW